MAGRSRRERGPYRHRGEAQWRRLLSAWRESELPARAFCARRRLALASFYRWRRLLSGTPASAAQGVFVPLRIAQQDARPAVPTHVPAASGIQIDLADDVAVRLEVGFDADSLRRALVILDELSC